jgi:hypothetical protein
MAPRAAGRRAEARQPTLCLPARPARRRRTQLWGAALPLNSPGVECIYDPLSRVGVCGDWLLGSSMEAAAVSGIALAQRIAAARDTPVAQQAGLALGLEEAFRPLLQAEAIGQFPAAAERPVVLA